MLSAIFTAVEDVFSAEMRGIFWKSLGLTLAALGAFWLVSVSLINRFVVLDIPYATGVVVFVTGFGLLIGMIFLIPLASAAISGLFVDEAAAIIETIHYPQDPPGTPLSLSVGALQTVKFFLFALAVTIVVFPLYLIFGLNAIIFPIVNGYLLGREYFSFAAQRFRSIEESVALRRRHRGTVFVSGLTIGMLAAIPLLNLLTPLYAAALMTHLHKAVSAEEADYAAALNS